ncbi:MAG TPA: hypothetical protein VGM91_19260 [Conexibacter sp.]|jgi:hypothetical protein
MFLSTYRFLDRKIRIGYLAWFQWVQVAIAVFLALGLSKAFGLFMPQMWALSTALTIAGLPVAAAIAAMESDFDVPAYLAAAISWRRGPKLLLPGADPAAAYAGYQLTTTDYAPAAAAHAVATLTPNDMEALWDRS